MKLLAPLGFFSAQNRLRLEEEGCRVHEFEGSQLPADPLAEVVILRSFIPLQSAELSQLPHLKLVMTGGVGLDHIDQAACQARGLPVMDSGSANSTSVAEFVWASLLHQSLPLRELSHQMKTQGGFPRAEFRFQELRGKHLGLIGLGRVGRRVALRAQAFEMKVCAVDPYVEDCVFKELGVEKKESESFFEDLDFLSLHCPLTTETQSLISKKEFQRMKRSLFLINSARAELIDEEALWQALETKQIAGAALDVFWEEPLPEKSPWRTQPQVQLSPHIAGRSGDAQQAIQDELTEKLLSWKKGHERE